MAYVFGNDINELDQFIRDEIELVQPLSQGNHGKGVRRVQEWLNLHGLGVVIDEQFGPATKHAVSQWQWGVGLPDSGDVDEPTYELLVQPMVDVLRQRVQQSIPFGDAVNEFASAHLMAHPREVGGKNEGPWVRLYMEGRQGLDFAWCAGFVSFLLVQAGEFLLKTPPIPGSVSCDRLAEQGKRANIFLEESVATPDDLYPGCIFLIRNSSLDWNHTGIVTESFDASFTTIEGNTNDSGSREGIEVCARSRSYRNTDFLTI